MTKFIKRPIIIEAVQVFKSMGGDNWADLPDWLTEAYEKGDILFLRDCVEILTLEGIMKAFVGDWIIQGIKGELYPCKDEIFLATYEKVND